MSLDKISKTLKSGTQDEKVLGAIEKELAHMDLDQLESLHRTDGASKPALDLISAYVQELKQKLKKKLEAKKVKEEQERLAKKSRNKYGV